MSSGWIRSAVRVGALAIVLGQLLPPAAVLAEEGSPKRFRTTWRATSAELELMAREGKVEISLDQAIAAALDRNLGLRVQRFQRTRALFTEYQNLGIYDFVLSANGSYRDASSPAASQLDGAAVRLNENQSFDLALDRLVPTGGQATLNFTNRRAESNSIFQQINPSFDAGLEAVFSQPLLANRGRLATERNLRIAGLDADVALEDLQLAVINTITQVQNSYWALVETRAQLEVAKQSLELAEELHQMNGVQVEVGTLAPLELVQSEVGIATRQEDIIRIQGLVDDAADSLRELLNVEDERIWQAEMVPSTPAMTDRLEVDLGEALQGALAGRPELRTQKLRIEQLEIDDKFFRGLKRPTLNLELRYGYAGLGGDVLVTEGSIFDPNPDFTVIEGGYSDALDQVIEREFDTWQVGINFRMPIENREAKGRATGARLALEQGLTRYEELLLSVRTEVRRAERGLRNAAQQIDSATVSRKLAERNLDAEEKRYENGISTSFQVLEIQEDLSQAQSREVNAITAYRRALATYYQATGTMLEAMGVQLEDDTRLDELKPQDE